MIRRNIGLPEDKVEKLREEGEITLRVEFHDGHVEQITIERITDDAPVVNYAGRRHH